MVPVSRSHLVCNVGKRGADVLTSYLNLQWLIFYSVIGAIAIVGFFFLVRIIYKSMARVRDRRILDAYRKELTSLITDRNEIIETSEVRWEKIQSLINQMITMQSAVSTAYGRLSRISEVMNEMNVKLSYLGSIIEELNKDLVKRQDKGLRRVTKKVGRPRKTIGMRKAPKKS